MGFEHLLKIIKQSLKDVFKIRDDGTIEVAIASGPSNIDIKLSVIRDDIVSIIKQPWSNNEFHGTSTPISGTAGDNTVTIKSGGDIDFDPSNKYIKSVAVELDSYSNGDYIKEIVLTDGTTRTFIAKNIPLSYGGQAIEFTSPISIPTGYWVEIVITLSSDKGLTIISEFVW